MIFVLCSFHFIQFTKHVFQPENPYVFHVKSSDIEFLLVDSSMCSIAVVIKICRCRTKKKIHEMKAEKRVEKKATVNPDLIENSRVNFLPYCS